MLKKRNTMRTRGHKDNPPKGETKTVQKNKRGEPPREKKDTGDSFHNT